MTNGPWVTSNPADPTASKLPSVMLRADDEASPVRLRAAVTQRCSTLPKFHL